MIRFWAGVCSVILLALFLATVYLEVTPGWKVYQRGFNRMEEEKLRAAVEEARRRPLDPGARVELQALEQEHARLRENLEKPETQQRHRQARAALRDLDVRSNLSVPPRDHTDRGCMSALSEERLFAAIKFGGAAQGKSALMPAWGGRFNDREIAALVAYLRGLTNSTSAPPASAARRWPGWSPPQIGSSPGWSIRCRISPG